MSTSMEHGPTYQLTSRTHVTNYSSKRLLKQNSYPNIMPLLSGRRIIYEENAKDGFDKGYMDDIAARNNMSWVWEPWSKVFQTV